MLLHFLSDKNGQPSRFWETLREGILRRLICLVNIKYRQCRIAAQLAPLNLLVSENTGFTDKDKVQEAISVMLDTYLGQGEVISQNMIAHHSRALLQSEIDEDEAFLEGYFSDKLMDEKWVESVEIILAESVPDDIFELSVNDAIALIRHNYTNYEEVLLSRWFKSDAAYSIIKERFNQAIKKKYVSSIKND